MYLRLFIPIFILFFTNSCNNPEEPSPTGSDIPQIYIYTPANNTNYIQGSEISITADIFDDKEIYTLNIEIIDLADNSLVYSFAEQHIHQPTYYLSTLYTVTSSTPADYQIVIIASDLDGNSIGRSVNVSVN